MIEPSTGSIIKALPVPVFFHDTDGTILGCNDAFSRLLGFSTGSCTGKSFYDLLGPDSAQQHRSADVQLLKTRRKLKYTVTATHKGGPAHFVIRKDIYDEKGDDIIVGTLIDITSQAQFEQKLHHKATHDDLTGLLNRSEMTALLQKNMARAQRYEEPYSLMLVDLDRFKIINDNYGHTSGDRVLVAFAELARKYARDSDPIGRWGGEEFIFLLPNTDSFHASNIAERLRAAAEQMHLTIDGQQISFTISIGVSSYPEDANNLEELLSIADGALYEAKRAGRNRIQFSNKRDSGIFSIGTQLQRALRENRLLPAYQPIVDLKTGEVCAEEALARLVLSDRCEEAEGFIQAASDLQLSHKIDHLITGHTIHRCRERLLKGNPIHHFVNMSADLLRHPELTHDLITLAEDCSNSEAHPNPLVIEITEREFIGSMDSAQEVLAPLLEFGMQIAIDDFGSGYSSFQYLADLPVSYLKIEGTLIKRMVNEDKVRRIIHGIRDVAKDLELITIAEHIEDERTADILREIGIDWGQGYHFGRAVLVKPD
jgi:diguanylate cyclase (GGDEF)-like protein/PAS domain S-box-containing protein